MAELEFHKVIVMRGCALLIILHLLFTCMRSYSARLSHTARQHYAPKTQSTCITNI